MSSKNENKSGAFKTRVGGQALIEGIMMLGSKKGCMAVRKPDKTIYTEVWELRERKWYNKAPFIRGCINFVTQLADGYKYINKSGEISGMFDEEESEKDKKAAKKKTAKQSGEIEKAAEENGEIEKVVEESISETPADTANNYETDKDTVGGGDMTVDSESGETEKPAEESGENKKADEENKKDDGALTTVITVISALISIVLVVGLFVMLPTFIFSGIQALCGETDISAFRSLIEGVLKIGIFIFYLWLTSLMKTMKRLYQYHGAEHKTIFCYENRQELTVENIKKFKRFHPRCGTSFIFLTLAISILVYTVLPINSEMFVEAFGVTKFVGDLLRICCKIIFLPIVVGISYELIRLAGGHDNLATRIISAPGLAIQRLTTKEPDDEMIEIAIAAVTPVLPERPEDAKW